MRVTALTAVRHEAGWMAALLLLLLAIILNTGSAGYWGRGGGDGDDGSGIGGTGRIPPSAGSGSGDSGFGGTGLKPYLGRSTDQGMIIPLPATPENLRESAPVFDTAAFRPSLDPLLTSVPAPVVAARPTEAVVSSGPIAISTELQFDIDSLGLLLATAPIAEYRLSHADSQHMAVGSPPEMLDENQAAGGRWAVLAQVAAEAETALQAPGDRTTMADATVSAETNRLREVISSRIQRPALPPVQRIRPVERISVLPPRILPMRI